MILEYYDWIKALHLISMTCWMAGLLYLPRLFVYHTKAGVDSDMAETFKIMEYRLLRFIMNPAMLLTWAFGLLMFWGNFEVLKTAHWLHAKLLFVVLLSGLHMFFARCRKNLAHGQNQRSERFYRIINEIPAGFLVVIVILAVVKPF